MFLPGEFVGTRAATEDERAGPRDLAESRACVEEPESAFGAQRKSNCSYQAEKTEASKAEATAG